MKMRIRRRWLVVLGICVLVALGTNPRVLPYAARWLDVGGSPQKADAVVLLNGGVNTRPLVAAALVRGRWTPKLILNTVRERQDEAAGGTRPTHEIARKVLEYGGVTGDEVVLLETAAETTFDEARAVADHLAAHPVGRILIVTEGPHTRRARWIFERVLAGQAVEIRMVSSPTDDFDSGNWWRNEAGFLFVASEYLKLFYYALRYGWLAYEVLGLCVFAFLLRAWLRGRRKLIVEGAVGREQPAVPPEQRA